MTSIRQNRNSAKLGLLLASLMVAGSASAQFSYPNFNSTSGLNMTGVASPLSGFLRLTDQVGGVGGCAWQGTAQNVALGFETNFRFRVTAPEWDAADGFTFTIQNQDPSYVAPVESLGGGLGYHNTLANSVVVEFDTFANVGCEPLTSIEWFNNGNGWYPVDVSEWYWPGYMQDSDNHVAIHTKGTGLNSIVYSDAGLGYGTPNFYIADGNEHTARIVYSAVNHTIKIYLDGSSQATATAPLNLSTTLSLNQGRAWVGFTAATGGAVSSHDILSWDYQVDFVGSIQALRAAVTALVTSGVALPADGQSLYAKLDAAIAAIAIGDTATARTKLQDFINQVNAFIGTHKLSVAQGQPLIDAAQAILNAL
jgi:hypothetical protein